MNTVFFDLDGTLLPMDQEAFVKAYFDLLSTYMISCGLAPDDLTRAVWCATQRMMQNDGASTNYEVFWSSFTSLYGEKTSALRADFARFYTTDFDKAKAATGTQPLAPDCIATLKKKGYRLVLATNPLFPREATLARIRWAGLKPDDFAWITTYDNANYCKPNPKYYEEILQNIGARAEDCLMIGNDAEEDMCAAALGMEVLLLTDCLINRKALDLSAFRQVDFAGLQDFISALPELNPR